MYIDKIFMFYRCIDFSLLTHLNCLVGCLKMTAWTRGVMVVLCVYVLYFFYLHLFCAAEYVSHGKVF